MDQRSLSERLRAVAIERQQDVEAIRGAYGADLATMRAWDQSRHHPSAVQAMAAARRVFAAVALPGMLANDAEALLGAPAQRDEGTNSWTYNFHDGEQGVVRRFKLRADRIESMEIIRTQ